MFHASQSGVLHRRADAATLAWVALYDEQLWLRHYFAGTTLLKALLVHPNDSRSEHQVVLVQMNVRVPVVSLFVAKLHLEAG